MRGLAVSELDCGSLHDVSLRVLPGECVCLSGPSGSGKTRLLRAIADLDPNTGTFALDGLPREAMTGPQWRRAVAMIPAESRWWADTVQAHFPEPVAPEALAPLGLDPALVARPVSVLSSGERQRFALLRALAVEPSLLLLDEPTANLDAANAQRVEDWLAGRRRDGLGMLWVTHDEAQIRRVADRRYIIRGSRLEEVRL
ncbi:MAG: ATP-binding cassette domain-containing protein [Ectothiorhodospiraceae bacterium]|jgi:ABC-type iron transport system FetAB ATPase subunit